MTDKIALLFCSGESIKLVGRVIPELLKKYSQRTDPDRTTVGINQFPVKFIEERFIKNFKRKSAPVDYWMAMDENISATMLKYYNGQKLIINKNNAALSIEQLKEKCAIDYLFGHSDTATLKDTGNLYGMYSTPINAIHLLLIRGYKVVIFGMDNRVDANGYWNYFYDENTLATKPDEQIQSIKTQIAYLSNLGEIYKVDKTNNIDVPVVDLQELLDGRLVITAEPVTEEAIEIHAEELEATPEDIIASLEDELVTLILPEFNPSGGTLNLVDASYEIDDRLVTVSSRHVDVLINQGFKYHDDFLHN